MSGDQPKATLADLRAALFEVGPLTNDVGQQALADAICMVQQIERQRLEVGRKLVEHASALVEAMSDNQRLRDRIDELEAGTADTLDSVMASEIKSSLDALTQGIARLGAVVEQTDEAVTA